MFNKETRKRLKQIEKEINKLKKETKKLEFRPCQSDLELMQKDEDIKALRKRINELEKEHDRYILKSGNAEHGPCGWTMRSIRAFTIESQAPTNTPNLLPI